MARWLTSVCLMACMAIWPLGCARQGTGTIAPSAVRGGQSRAQTVASSSEGTRGGGRARSSDEVADALRKVVRNGQYEQARQHLRQAVEGDAADAQLLLQLGVIAFGFDRFDHGSWEASESYLDRALARDPGNEVALHVKEHNRKYEPWPGKPPSGQPGVREVRANRPIFVAEGLPMLNAGERMTFASDGIFKSLVGADGHVIWRVVKDPKLGYIWVNGDGVRHFHLAAGSPEKPCASFDEVTGTRKGICGME